MKRIRQITVPAAAALLAAACCDTFSDSAPETSPEPATITVAELRARCGAGSIDVTADAVIAGRVTTSDEAGNFDRTFFVEDANGGIEIMAGTYDLHNKYPVGAAVSVSISGCTAALAAGVVQIGMKPESYSSYAVGYFKTGVLLDRYITRGSALSEVVPIPAAAGSDALCGRLVAIGGLRCEPTDPTEERIFAGLHRFVARDGSEVYSQVGDDALFARDTIPGGEVSLCGILLHGNVTGAGKQFIIKPRSRDDCTICDSTH